MLKSTLLGVLILISIFLAVNWLLAVIWTITPFRPFKRLYHDILGWHEPGNGSESFDGASFHAKCRFCGKEIMQDSQGNWF